MNRSLSADVLRAASAPLEQANRDFANIYPGESGRRQPVHTVYGGAHLFKFDSAARLGALARRSLEQYGGDALTFAKALDLDSRASTDSRSQWLIETVYDRVVEKLRREPVEDFRIDFEDGYGNRSDAEEDGHAESAAREVAGGMEKGALPPFIGIRIKPFTEELRQRSMRTLDIFLTTLVETAGGRLPENFFVTLPKVTIPEQVTALADLFDALEPALALPARTLKMELMIETTQSIINRRGECNLPLLHEAARGRCVAAHFGTYDYTASCQITAAHQHMLHPACDFAKHMMQVAFGGTGVWLSDGATNIMPVPVHRASEGKELTGEQIEDNRSTVHRAWRLHFDHVRHSLMTAFYQGWDLHPAQLPTRYAAVYSFFLESLEPASERLRNFVEKAAKATLVGDVFDDAATGQGLLNYFLRALNCGAVTESEATELSGLTLEELRSGSFVKILNSRQNS
jgi:citrate lyase beta subunit